MSKASCVCVFVLSSVLTGKPINGSFPCFVFSLAFERLPKFNLFDVVKMPYLLFREKEQL